VADVYVNQKVFPYKVKVEAAEQQCYADPMIVWYRFMEATQGDASVLVERAYPPKQAATPGVELTPEQLAAMNAMQDMQIAASRIEIGRAMLYALELPPLDRKTGWGLPTAEGERLFLEWNGWMDEKKNAPDGSPTPSTPAPATGSPAPWATNLPSVSG
jgi:hypothetical protein